MVTVSTTTEESKCVWSCGAIFKDICDCLKVSIKLLCVNLFPSSGDLYFFSKSFLFRFLFFVIHTLVLSLFTWSDKPFCFSFGFVVVPQMLYRFYEPAKSVKTLKLLEESNITSHFGEYNTIYLL